MDADLQSRADQALDQAIQRTGARDPRDFYRKLLLELKEQDQEAYEGAVNRWKTEVVEPLARGDGSPLDRWLAYGLDLARTLEDGNSVRVDETGRALPLERAPSWKDLVLHLPDRKAARAIPVSIPPALSAPQRATMQLLVQGKVKLPDA